MTARAKSGKGLKPIDVCNAIVEEFEKYEKPYQYQVSRNNGMKWSPNSANISTEIYAMAKEAIKSWNNRRG